MTINIIIFLQCALFNWIDNEIGNRGDAEVLRPFSTYPDTNLKTLDRHYRAAKCENSAICLTEN